MFADNVARFVAVVYTDEIKVGWTMNGRVSIGLDQCQRGWQAINLGQIARDAGKTAAEARVVGPAQQAKAAVLGAFQFAGFCVGKECV